MYKKNLFKILLSVFLMFLCFSVFAQETGTYSIDTEKSDIADTVVKVAVPDSGVNFVNAEIFTDTQVSVGLVDSGPIKIYETGTIIQETALDTSSVNSQVYSSSSEPAPVTKPQIPLSTVKAGLSLMPTAYVRVSQAHPSETGFNADFLFGFYIGEIYERLSKNNKIKNNFFVPYRIYTFGYDSKISFNLGQLLNAVGIVYREEYAAQRIGQFLDAVDPGFATKEQKYFPTVAIGMRGWLFSSMGTGFDLATAFEGAQWVQDYYFVVSKKIGDWGVHAGYIYGSFYNNFYKQIKSSNVLNQGDMDEWNVDSTSNSNTLCVGFDVNVPWGNKKFCMETIFSSLDTYLINTSTGLWGFDLAFLKIPQGFSVIGYWSFRSNVFTFF